MLLTKDLIKDVEEKYAEMLEQVNIPDFTKCIAQFSGLKINEVSDFVIKDYLITWAKNKYEFYKMLGNKLQLDKKLDYKKQRNSIQKEITDLCRKYPTFILWLKAFQNCKMNKIESPYDLDFHVRLAIQEFFPELHIGGTSITHFFKSYLKAPNDLITSIAAIFENDRIQANYTLSIDPVDMMLASENPYDWNSCYRLENLDSSHADGCLAALLDNSSLISYIWKNEGKLRIYDKYEFKSVRYKMSRQWISVHPKMCAIHFNAFYPKEDEYEEDFLKDTRAIIENQICRYKNYENKWKKNEKFECYRGLGERYGYDEFKDNRIYQLSNIPFELEVKEYEWTVYNEKILCPCGCGCFLEGSDNHNDIEYNGDGFCAENEETKYWCDYCDDWCNHYGTECETCYYYLRNHPVCELDRTSECFELECDDKGIVECNPDFCCECPLWKQHHQEEEEEDV